MRWDDGMTLRCPAQRPGGIDPDGDDAGAVLGRVVGQTVEVLLPVAGAGADRAEVEDVQVQDWATGSVCSFSKYGMTWTPIDARFHKRDLIRRIQRIARYSSRISLYEMDAANS